jgi:hypothetical protein
MLLLDAHSQGGAPASSFYAPELSAVLRGTASPASIGVSLVDAENFFLCLALCHTVVPERDTPTSPIVYQAESPDEGALVQASPLRLPRRVSSACSSPVPAVVTLFLAAVLLGVNVR